MEGPTYLINSKHHRGSEDNRLPAGGGVSIMTGTGQSNSNIQGIVTNQSL